MCRIVYQIDNSYTYGKTSFFFNEIIIDAMDIKNFLFLQKRLTVRGCLVSLKHWPLCPRARV